MKTWIKKNKFSIIISLVFFVIFYFFEKENRSYYSYIILYFGLYTFSSILPDWIVLKQVKKLIAIPAVLLLLIGPLIQVFIFIMYALVIPFVTIALIFEFFPEYLFGIDLNYSTNLYLVLITGTIFTTLFVEKIMLKINRSLNYDKPEKRKKSQMELALTLVNTERIRFLIYTLFFCYLIVFSISRLGNFEIFDTPMVNYSIFYSFVTFIAFERVITNLKLMRFSPKKFFDKLLNTWEKHDYFKNVDEKSQ
ncbi:hypothetical protein MM213_12580 [Belliella sp. R4-6]|uniref:Uncharacterized protein n=1 Tax=Belliella alkalica TaxID=1730871 RepID=A0ABS9VD19_9BACT|nr:hypothetical protein [Belliella alkalica]MCH7414326.1 hypothetical protein [Belliella alkalica]